MGKSAIIVDGDNRLYASYFAYDNLQYGDLPTSCVFGMPSMIRALIHQLKPDDIFIAWDGHRNTAKKQRKAILPQYKQHRASRSLVDIQDLVRQKKIVQGLLDALGLKQFVSNNLEGDDLIYALYRKLKGKFDFITINSADKDFNQMLSKQVKIYSESKKTLITRGNVKSYFGYRAKETIDWLSLIGDKSDDIPGLTGCGQKTARALLDKYGSIVNFLDSGDDFPRVNKAELIKIHKRNYRLISLEYFYRKFVKNQINITPLLNRRPKVDISKVQRIAAGNGIKRFLDPNFVKPFKLIN